MHHCHCLLDLLVGETDRWSSVSGTWRVTILTDLVHQFALQVLLVLPQLSIFNTWLFISSSPWNYSSIGTRGVTFLVWAWATVCCLALLSHCVLWLVKNIADEKFLAPGAPLVLFWNWGGFLLHCYWGSISWGSLSWSARDLIVLLWARPSVDSNWRQ